jgi:hypothetical protein
MEHNECACLANGRTRNQQIETEKAPVGQQKTSAPKCTKKKIELEWIGMTGV